MLVTTCLSRDIPEDVLNTYCWIHSTFTVAGEAGAYPGVRGAGTATRRYGKYYQWVAFTLFLQISRRDIVKRVLLWQRDIDRFLKKVSHSIPSIHSARISPLLDEGLPHTVPQLPIFGFA
ncbi:uncharacterized protein LOC123698900 [Colias croceus]|uniref:uncharacterized protein LOC123698900 n=1 Tax=Colias crocea TaxID=72248 RepID=UPI001E27CCC6|nr:uncharacterized protein LOC123698900 [Colias croceus]